MDIFCSSRGPFVPDSILQPLLAIFRSSSLQEALEILIGVSRNDDGRSDLASKSIMPLILQLAESIYNSSPSDHHLLLLSLRLLRNLCAGEAENQSSFAEHNGVEIVWNVISLAVLDFDNSDYLITRTGLQILANVSLGGQRQQRAVWDKFFHERFVQIAKLRRKETCDPLCMIIYVCCDGISELSAELYKVPGLTIMAEILRTASAAGFGENWLKLLVSRICLEGSCFSALFHMLSSDDCLRGSKDAEKGAVCLTSEQAFLLSIVSDIMNERIGEIRAGTTNIVSCVVRIFKEALEVVDFSLRGQSGLPTGNTSIDVLGYSLAILRDICAVDCSDRIDSGQEQEDVVSALLSTGLLDLLLHFLGELEPPSTTRKSIKQEDSRSSKSPKVCPYKGFRRDIVSVIGNCAYRRKDVQDEIRQKDGVLLLLQQCVVDEDNPFLREWGFWCVRNLLEGNAENQKLVTDLELQGTLDSPELSTLGVRVELDPHTQRAKLINIS